jgi:hypothetical protein
MPIQDLDFCGTFVELFVFVIDSPVYSPPGSQDSPLYSPPGSQDSLEYSPPGSQPKLLSKTVAGAKYSRESRLSYWIHNGAVTLCCIRHKSFYMSTSSDAGNKYTRKSRLPGVFATGESRLLDVFKTFRCIHYRGVEIPQWIHHRRVVFDTRE